jgi:hypothetical protein
LSDIAGPFDHGGLIGPDSLTLLVAATESLP